MKCLTNKWREGAMLLSFLLISSLAGIFTACDDIEDEYITDTQLSILQENRASLNYLLKNSTSYPVMLVESEKTAVIMSHFIPDYIWLATGGKNGCFNSEAMQVLKNREVTLIPDLGATEQWKAKSALLLDVCKKVAVSDILERTATEEQRSQGLDIADFFLFSPTKRQILQLMIKCNPALQLLIDELDLELIE